MSARPELGTTRVAGQAGRLGAGPADAPPSPYDRPVLKEPVWTWEIPVYFYAGGMAGAAAGLGRLAEARGNEVLARRASALALGGALASPALLVSDLGRPERFLHMLRMFKVTSPMSVGSWILSAFGAAAGAGWLDHLTGGRVPGGRAARTTAAVLGLPVASYTAALVANTSVPVWHEARLMLPFVFVSGAAASAGGALVAVTAPSEAAPARRLAVAGALAELGAKQVMEARLGELSDAYKAGAAHKLGIAGKLAVAGGAAVVAIAARRSRPAAVAGGALLNGGAVLARWSVFKAGFQSAADPRHTVAPQRRRVESGATAAASTPPSEVQLP